MLFGRAWAMSAAVIVAVLLAASLGYIPGHSSGRNVFSVDAGIAYSAPDAGTAYLGAQKLNRAPTGFAYALPAYVPWIDQTGTLHEGSHASCLPYYKAVHVVRMETVQYPIADGSHQGTVLWVQC